MADTEWIELNTGDRGDYSGDGYLYLKKSDVLGVTYGNGCCHVYIPYHRIFVAESSENVLKKLGRPKHLFSQGEGE